MLIDISTYVGHWPFRNIRYNTLAELDELAPIYHEYTLEPQITQDSYFTVQHALPVMDLAEELDVPVRICASIENFRGRSPLDNFNNISSESYYALLSKNEKVHVFCTGFAPITADKYFTDLLKARKNTYFDTTQFGVMTPNAGKSVMAVISEEQLCFGSLSPFAYMETALIRTNYCPEFDFEKIRSNPARAFKALR